MNTTQVRTNNKSDAAAYPATRKLPILLGCVVAAIAVLSFAGCSPERGSTATNTPVPQEPTRQVDEALHFTPASDNPDPTTTPLPLFLRFLEDPQATVEVPEELPAGLSGKIVVNGRATEVYTTGVIDLERREFVNLRGEAGIVIADQKVSPNGELLAYLRTKYSEDVEPVDERLVTVDSELSVIGAHRRDRSWSSILGWSIDERIIISSLERQDGEAFVVDPASGSAEWLAVPSAEIYDSHPPSSAWGFPVRFDPTLMRAVYLRDIFSEDGLGAVLRDMSTGEDLWEVSHSSMVGNPPAWSPDGQRFAVPIPSQQDGYTFDISILTRDGELVKSLDLGSVYDQPVRLIDRLEWSPKGDQIAFVLATRQDRDEGPDTKRLITANITEVTLTEYDLSSSPVSDLGLLVWSPDGKAIATELFRDPNHSELIILDLESGRAFSIAENMSPVGWMIP